MDFSWFLRKNIHDNILEEQDKLDILINCISSDVYDYIPEDITFEPDVNRLKPIKEIIARHIIATSGQREEDDIEEYDQGRELFAKECSFKSVDAVQNRDDRVRCAFITGLQSSDSVIYKPDPWFTEGG